MGPPPPPTAGNVQLATAAGAGAGRAGGRGGAGGAGRGGPGAPGSAGREEIYINPRGGVEEDYPLDAHVRNFLDCVKSRQKPNADMEIDY